MKLLKNTIHDDWYNIIFALYHQEPLFSFIRKILPTLFYYPLNKEEVFKSFYKGFEDINVVVIRNQPGLLEDYPVEREGVFNLYKCWTYTPNDSHYKYWEYFTNQIITYLSLKHSCIWIVVNKENNYLINNIKGKIFYVKNYNEETIKNIPINEDFNYVFTQTDNYIEYSNIILKNKKLKEVKW